VFRDGMQVGGGHAVADLVEDAELEVRDPVLRLAVVVGVEGNAARLRSIDDRLVDRVGAVGRQDRHDASVLRRPTLDALEHGQDVVPGPAVRAEVCPRVVIRASPARPDHAVQAA